MKLSCRMAVGCFGLFFLCEAPVLLGQASHAQSQFNLRYSHTADWSFDHLCSISAAGQVDVVADSAFSHADDLPSLSVAVGQRQPETQQSDAVGYSTIGQYKDRTTHIESADENEMIPNLISCAAAVYDYPPVLEQKTEEAETMEQCVNETGRPSEEFETDQMGLDGVDSDRYLEQNRNTLYSSTIFAKRRYSSCGSCFIEVAQKTGYLFCPQDRSVGGKGQSGRTFVL